ncbi:MAG TPA: collagen-like protein [Thermoleophilaceae bacterium]
MRLLSRNWARTTVVAVAAGGLSVLATSAVVGAQSSTEVIHACADGRGTLRMIPAGGSCELNEAPVSWNAQGIQGVPGPTGATGAQGPAGARGRTGRTGKQGNIKFKLSGDLGTQLILGRLKALDKKVVDIQDKVQDTKSTALYLKGYLKVHHQNGATCKQVEDVYQLIQVINSGDSGVLPLGLGCG